MEEKSEKCSCSLSLVHSGADDIVGFHGLKRQERVAVGHFEDDVFFLFTKHYRTKLKLN